MSLPLRVYAENHGCTFNKFDFEILLTQLVSAGSIFVKNEALADIILVNTCGVKTATENRLLTKLRRFDRLKKWLIISGCLPKINLPAIQKAAPHCSVIIDPNSVHRLRQAITLTQEGVKKNIWFSSTKTDKLQSPKLLINPVIEIIPISEGCLGDCNYCCVRNARGSLVSYPQDSLHKRMENAVIDQIHEIWLTAQDVGAYGLDRATNLVELLKMLCQVQGKYWIRVGMMNPKHVLPLLSELINIYRNPKIFKFLHIPVQSGNNKILHRMNRKYSIEEFKHIVKRFRQIFPSLTLATDVICGFPGESDLAFYETCKLLQAIQPDIINVSKFYPRPNTQAQNMQQLDPKVIKKRSQKLSQIVKSLTHQRNKIWQNWSGEALVDEKGRGTSWIARNFAYKPLVIQTPKRLLGRFINVRVTKIHATYLDAEVM